MCKAEKGERTGNIPETIKHEVQRSMGWWVGCKLKKNVGEARRGQGIKGPKKHMNVFWLYPKGQ